MYIFVPVTTKLLDGFERITKQSRHIKTILKDSLPQMEISRLIWLWPTVLGLPHYCISLDSIFSPDSWQAIGVLTSQRWGLRWRTFQPAAPQGAVQDAVQTAVVKSGKGAVQGAVQGAEQGAVQDAVQTAVAKSGKGAVQGAVQAAVQTAVHCARQKVLLPAQ